MTHTKVELYALLASLLVVSSALSGIRNRYLTRVISEDVSFVPPISSLTVTWRKELP